MGNAVTIAEFAKGAGLLLVVSYVVLLAGEKLTDRPGARALANGVIFGITAAIAGEIPLQIASNITIDIRPVLIGVGSAFGGPVVAALSGAIAVGYDFAKTGGGVWASAGVIVGATLLGSGYWWLRDRHAARFTPLAVLLFGLILHGFALAAIAVGTRGAFLDVYQAAEVGTLLVFVPATALLFLLMRDIEIRAVQRSALAVRDADYRNIVDNMTDIFYRTDAEGRLSMVSPSVSSLLGYMPDELIGRDLKTLYCVPEDRQRFLDKLEQSNGLITNYEAPLRAKDGREVWVSASSRCRYDDGGNVVGVEGTARDITERRRSEEHSRILAERLSLATSVADIGVWDRDLVRDELIWDSRMHELYGLDEDGLPRGRDDWEAMLHPEDRGRVQREIAEALAGKQEIRTTFRAVLPDDSIRHLEGQALVRRDADGTPQRLIGVNRDITAEVEANRRLMQAQKMEAVGQLTGGIAHDFNNLLAVILGNLEVMEDWLEPGSELVTLRESALRATLRGTDLTQRLLAFSRRQVLSPVSTDVNELVTELSKLLQRTLGESVQIECRLDDDVNRVMIDPGQLESALLNLAINARDAMPDGGRLIVETTNTVLNPDVVPESAIVGPCVMVSLRDSGTGIPADIRDRIFEPFFTTKEDGKGSGLGLSMVYGFVKQSGGHITADSRPGEGTVFRLFLPQAEDNAGERPDWAVGAPLKRGSEHILLVEDDAEVRGQMHTALERLGYQVHVAEAGPDALAMLDDLARLDLLITDMVMPRGMDGVEVANSVRQRHRDARVLYMTGYADRPLPPPSQADDGTAFLPKPCRRHVLAHTVRQLLDAG